MKNPRRAGRLAFMLLASACVMGEGWVRADVITLPASRDNTLFESATGALSNGAGEFLFAGKTAIPQTRRALIAFDVAAAVPAGSTITSVQLTLNMSLTIALGVPVSLHRAAADWGEGTSDAPMMEGMGTAADTGDATWVHTFFDTSFWAQPGGDYNAVPAATIVVDQIGPYTWGSTAGMVADAQSWLDSPAGNFGWVIVGDESVTTTAKRFDSRENRVATLRPALRVEFTPPPAGAGRVPDGGPTPGVPLTVDLAPGGDITLSWSASCTATDTDFAVYEGVLEDFTSHQPRLCSTAGSMTVTLTPGSGGRYYLVVPHNGAREGSYGLKSDLSERPASSAPCVPQSIATCP
ncbi:MAG: DNRLRE domain-containing protein [Candidatus Polarisedimenticolia bacterium]